MTTLPVLLEASLPVLHVLKKTQHCQTGRALLGLPEADLSIPPETLHEEKNHITLDSAQDWVCQRCFSHRIAGQFFSFSFLCKVSGTCVLSNRKWGKQLEGTKTSLDSYILDSLITHPQCNGFQQRFVRLFFQRCAWKEILAEEITSSSHNRMKSKSKGWRTWLWIMKIIFACFTFQLKW